MGFASSWGALGFGFLRDGPGAVGQGDHAVAALVQLVVVPMAQQHQVVQIRRTSVEPVDDVVRIAS